MIFGMEIQTPFNCGWQSTTATMFVFVIVVVIAMGGMVSQGSTIIQQTVGTHAMVYRNAYNEPGDKLMSGNQTVLRMLAGLFCAIRDGGTVGAIYECSIKDKKARKAFRVVRKEVKKQGYRAKLYTDKNRCRLVVNK